MTKHETVAWLYAIDTAHGEAVEHCDWEAADFFNAWFLDLRGTMMVISRGK